MENVKNKVINPNEYGSLLYDEKEEKAILNVIKARRIFRYSKTDYPYVNMFEESLAKKVNSKYCLGVINGTAGLVTALKAINIKPNDKVLVSSYTYIATALAVKLVGAIPIPLDIDLRYGVDIDDLKEELDTSCKAVIVTHLQGRCFDLSKVKSILEKNNTYLIEDACQGFASNYNEKYAGTYGDIGVYSFQQFKQISSGEGGAIVTNNAEFYERARNYTDMGAIRDRFPNWDGETCLFGENYRMNNLIGGILYEQMKKLDYMIEKQQNSRKEIMKKLSKYNINSIVYSEDPDGDTGMNIVLLVNEENERETIIKYIKDKYNVELRKMWSSLYFDNKLFEDNKLTDKELKKELCKKTKDLISKMLVISVPPILSENDENIIVDAIVDLRIKEYIN